MLAAQTWVSQHVGHVSAQRGLQYYREGRVTIDSVSLHQGPSVDQHVQVVRGTISGTSITPYQAWASLLGDTITDSHCNCPVGGSGKCKHVAALLIHSKCGTEAVSKQTLATTPSASSGQRTLWNGPFSSSQQVSMNSSPTKEGYNPQTPKKQVCVQNSHSSPAWPSMQPGFSLTQNSAVCAPINHSLDFPSSQQQSKPNSPVQNRPKPNFVNSEPRQLFPSPGSPSSKLNKNTPIKYFRSQLQNSLIEHISNNSVDNNSNLLKPQQETTITDHSRMHIVDNSNQNNNTINQIDVDNRNADNNNQSSFVNSISTGIISDTESYLVEELRASRKKCSTLQEQVDNLQFELMRKNAEIEALKKHFQKQIQNLSENQQQQQYQQYQQNQQQNQQNHHHHQQHYHLDQVEKFIISDPQMPIKLEQQPDSIEDLRDDQEIENNRRKREREWNPADRPGAVKRLKIETGSHTNPSSDKSSDRIEQEQSHSIQQQQQSEPQFVCLIDSQTLNAALDMVEGPFISPDHSVHEHDTVNPTPPVPPHLLYPSIVNPPKSPLSSSQESIELISTEPNAIHELDTRPTNTNMKEQTTHQLASFTDPRQHDPKQTRLVSSRG